MSVKIRTSRSLGLPSSRVKRLNDLAGLPINRSGTTLKNAAGKYKHCTLEILNGKQLISSVHDHPRIYMMGLRPATRIALRIAPNCALDQFKVVRPYVTMDHQILT